MLRELAEVASALLHADSALRRPESNAKMTMPADTVRPDSAATIAGSMPGLATPAADAMLELLLVSRREHAVYNSVGQHLPALRRRRPFNPAYMNPADAERIGVVDDATVLIESATGSIRAVVQCAPDVRQGVVSLAHGFEPTTGEGRAASTAALIDDANGYDPISGLPRMSAVPVRVRKAAAATPITTSE